jgi:glycosyltransferase involved in cell wall biosynthesis
MSWRDYVYGLIAAEISRLTKYSEAVIQYEPLPQDNGLLLSLLECSSRTTSHRDGPYNAEPSADGGPRCVILLNGNLNYSHDIQALFASVKCRLGRTGRLVAVVYNPYLRWIYVLASRLGIRKAEEPTTFVTQNDLRHLARLSGFELVSIRNCAYVPFRLLGIGTLANRVLPIVPILRWLALSCIVTFRPLPDLETAKEPSLSIIVPARNEEGNIEDCLRRIPDFPGVPVEVIFVEGNSSDGTWPAIQRAVADSVGRRVRVHAYRQAGQGKQDAVQLGMQKATNDLVTILDADLTMPPEMLARFYTAYREGLADFVNGHRLVYPMEKDAMRFLNLLGNIFFAKLVSWLADVNLGDALCGTKMLRRADYALIEAWRRDVGIADPFGDFELLFFASTLRLGIADVPIRYKSRTYGATNIRRFKDGFLLLRYCVRAFCRFKLGASPVGGRVACKGRAGQGIV